MSQPNFKIKRSWRFYLQIGISFCLSALLLILLGATTDLNLGDIIKIMLNIDPIFIVLIILSTLIHFSLSALKWRIITIQMSNELNHVSSLFFLFYTSLGALLGQFIPLHISTMIMRGIGLRLHQKENLKRGIVSSVYEQGFDILIPLVIVIASIFKLLNVVGFLGWLIIAIASLIILWLVAITSSVKLLNWLAAILDRIHWQLKLLNTIREIVHRVQNTDMLDSQLMTKVFILSVIRYANLTIRAVLVALAVNLDIDILDVIFVMPIVQASMFIPLTPGNLGVVEWTWIGILTGLGNTVANASHFALLHRVLIFISVTFITSIIGVFFLGKALLVKNSKAKL